MPRTTIDNADRPEAQSEAQKAGRDHHD